MQVTSVIDDEIFQETCESYEDEYQVSDVCNNEFIVYGNKGRFNWIIHGSRGKLDTEPYKNSVKVKGDGPYKWI